MSSNEWNQELPALKGIRFSIYKGAWIAVYEDGSEVTLTRAEAVAYKDRGGGGGVSDLTALSYYDKGMVPLMLDIFY